MIKKATERPIEVEYIEFKGRENFDEVSKFINGDVALLTTQYGRDQIIFNYNISNEQNIRYGVGTIFYKAKPRSQYDYPELKITNKEDFFMHYIGE